LESSSCPRAWPAASFAAAVSVVAASALVSASPCPRRSSSVVVAAVNIMNTMYTSILERTSEIGVMKSIGATNKFIILIFIIEAGTLGFVGGLLGIFFGYVIANNSSSVMAFHDCDISTYSRELLARLCYPVVNRNLGYEFCKGYYARVTDQLHGRVTRLFITPIIRSLRMILGGLPYLEYIDSFRYPLAGEFAMHRDLARSLRILGNWGLEVGVLSEVFRNTALKRICQVDLCEKYDHEHREIPSLVKMATDIAETIFRYLGNTEVAL